LPAFITIKEYIKFALSKWINHYAPESNIDGKMYFSMIRIIRLCPFGLSSGLLVKTATKFNLGTTITLWPPSYATWSGLSHSNRDPWMCGCKSILNDRFRQARLSFEDSMFQKIEAWFPDSPFRTIPQQIRNLIHWDLTGGTQIS